MAGRLVDYIGGGLVADRPNEVTLDGLLTSGAAGFYYAEDEGALYSLNRSIPDWEAVGGSGGSSSVAIFTHQEATGVSGGNATTGAWTTRTLNTTDFSNIAGASISSNVISLPAGTYTVTGSQQFYRTQYSKTRLRNTTDGTDAALGETGFVNETGIGQSLPIFGGFTIAAAKDFEFQYNCSANANINGLGLSDPSDPAVFASLMLQKIA